MIFELIESGLEVLNLILAVIIVFIGIGVYKILNLDLKKAWGYFLIAIALFGLHEIVGVLAEFGIYELEGFYAFTEFLFIIFFLISTGVFKRLFMRLLSGKKRGKKDE